MSRTARSVAILFAAVAAPSLARAADIHPDIVLKDVDGRLVRETGKPIHTWQSCGGECHDVAYIESTSYHVQPAADAPTSPWDRGSSLTERFAPLVHGDVVPGREADREHDPRWVGGSAARPMNCLLCHTAHPDFEARADVLTGNDFGWEATATLAGVLVDRGEDGQWHYRMDVFGEDGSVPASVMGLQEPSSEACLACHGQLGAETNQPFVIDAFDHLAPAWATGLVFSGASIHASGLNLARKAEKTRAFDIHAERLLDCASCHHSVDNPAMKAKPAEPGPSHLQVDARREALGEWVRRPSHHLATGSAPQSFLGHAVRDSMRRCEDCHAAETTHRWLPYPRRHFQALACETCHVPEIDVPVLETVDWTVLLPSGGPRTVFRGPDVPPNDVEVLRAPFHPVWLNRVVRGEEKITPNNLVTQVFWVGEEPRRPVSVKVLKRVLFDASGALLPEWVDRFDVDGSGTVEVDEMRLQTEGQVEAIRAGLEAEGIQSPHIVAEVEAYGIHHGVAGRGHAAKDCATCHREDAPMTAAVPLARALPPGTEVKWMSRLEMAGELETTADGQLNYHPKTRTTGRYVLGQHRFLWVDRLGFCAILLVLMGTFGHAIARVVAGRKH